jgi:hypothetical protein
MSSFLKFLNTADDEELRQLPGIGATLAKNIAAARPFSSDDDVFRVKGLDEKLLVKLQAAYFERFQATPELSGPPPVQGPSPAFEGSASGGGPGEPRRGPGFWGRLGRAFINLVRVVFWLAILVAILGGLGAAAYFGIPYLYERFVQPVEINAIQIQQVATRQAEDLATTSAEVAELQERLASLEGRVGGIESDIADHSAAIGQLEQMQNALESAGREQRTELLGQLEYQVKLTRAVELLSRGRLYLSQSNFGLARQDVLSARELLVDLQSLAPSDQIGPLRAVIARLDLALGNLPGYPVIAADDLEIGWQVLIDGLPANAEALATPLGVFPTPAPTATETPLPPPTPTSTPTPIDTPEPRPT